MPSKSLDKNSPIPLYRQLKNLLVNSIESGELQTHDRLPSEREYSELYDISRQTVRRALSDLVFEGQLVRQPGKGTYVAPEKFKHDLLHGTSFTQLVLEWGKTSAVKTVEFEVAPAPGFAARLLDIDIETPVLRFERVRLVDGVPVAVFRSYLPLDIGKPLQHTRLDSQSLIVLLKEICNVDIVRSEETMEPTVADEYEAELLNIEPGAPLQLMTGRLFSDSERVVECHKSLFRGDTFKFSFEGRFNPQQDAVQFRSHPSNQH